MRAKRHMVLVVLGLWALAPLATRAAEPGTIGFQTAQAARLLQAIEVLGPEHQQSTDVKVHSSLLCFCLHKGPETIREMRRAAREWFAKGVAFFQAQNHAEAITAFTHALQRNPRDARAYTNRGVLYGKTGNYEQASADLTRAISLDPQRAEAYYARSVIATILGQEQRAREDVQRAAQLGYDPARRLYHTIQSAQEQARLTK